MNASDVYTAARARLGLNFPDGLLGEANTEGVAAVMNTALAEMVSDYDWPFLYAETEFEVYPGKSVYPVPDCWLRTAFLVLDGYGHELVWRQRRTHFELPPDGIPTVFDTSGDQILIAPEPDGAYKVRHGYYKGFHRIPVGADLEDIELPIPPPFDQLLILFTARAMSVLIKDRELHQMLSGEINEYRSRVADNRRRQQTTGRVKTRNDY